MPTDNHAEREAAIDAIIDRIERLRAEMARLRDYAITLKSPPDTLRSDLTRRNPEER
jgi:hypothetical protein